MCVTFSSLIPVKLIGIRWLQIVRGSTLLYFLHYVVLSLAGDALLPSIGVPSWLYHYKDNE